MKFSLFYSITTLLLIFSTNIYAENKLGWPGLDGKPSEEKPELLPSKKVPVTISTEPKQITENEIKNQTITSATEENITEEGSSTNSIPHDTSTDIEQVNKLLQLYLDNKSEEAQKLAKESLKKTNIDPAYAKIYHYLAGDQIDDNSLFLACEQDAGAACLAFLSMYIRKINNAQTEDKNLLVMHLKNYTENAKIANTPAFLKWEKFIASWIDWTQNDFPKRKNLPLLMTQRSSYQNIAEMTLKEFTERHEKIKNRPKLTSLKIDKNVISQYLESINDPSLKKMEERRFKFLEQTIEYLSKPIAKNPFTGSIRLESKTVSGTISNANKNVFIVKTGKRSSKSYNWEELHPLQVPVFLQFIANKRKSVGANDSVAVDIAQDYLLSSVVYMLCDDVKKAYEFAIKAEKTSDKVKDLIKKLYLE